MTTARVWKAVILVSLILGWALPASADQQLASFNEPGIQLELYELSPTSGSLRVQVSRPSTDTAQDWTEETEVFSLDNPSRLVIDVPNQTRVKTRNVSVETPLLSSVRLGGHSGKSRIVLDFSDNPVLDFQTNISPHEKQVTVTFRTNLVPQTSETPEVPTPPTIVKTQPVAKTIEKPAQKPQPLPQPPEPPQPLVVSRVQPTVPQVKRPTQKLEPTQRVHTKIIERPVLPKKPKPEQAKKKKASPIAKSTPESRTKAYTVTGDGIEVVEVAPKTGYSRTPLNPGAHYPSAQHNLPSVLPSSSEEEARELSQTETATKPQEAASVQPEAQDSSGEKQAERQASEIPEQQPKSTKPSSQQAPSHQPRVPLEALLADLPEPPPPESSSGILELTVSLILITFVVIFALRRHEIATLLHAHGEAPSGYQPSLIELSLREHYDILGCKETDSDAEIKARYRHLAKVFHSDKLQSSELPDEVLELTNERFKRVQTAYERVRDARGFQ